MDDLFCRLSRLLREAVAVLSEAQLAAWSNRLRLLADELDTLRRARAHTRPSAEAESRLWKRPEGTRS